MKDAEQFSLPYWLLLNPYAQSHPLEHTHVDGTRHSHADHDDVRHRHQTVEAWGPRKADRVVHDTGPVWIIHEPKA